MSKRNDLAEVMLLSKISPHDLKSKVSLISGTNLLFPFAKMVYSSKNGILLQFKRRSQIALSFDGLVFWSVRGDILICSPDLSVYPSILLRNLNQSLRRNICIWSLKRKTFESFLRLLKRIWSLQEFSKHLRDP